MEECCPRICSLVFGRSFLRPAKMVELRTSRFTAPSADQTNGFRKFSQKKKKEKFKSFYLQLLPILMIFLSWNLAFGVSCVPSTGYS